MTVPPIPRDAALARIQAAGLTLAEARQMPDDALLRLPSIGRRTLAFIRASDQPSAPDGQSDS